MTNPEKLQALTPTDLVVFQSREQADEAFGLDVDAVQKGDAAAEFRSPTDPERERILDGLSRLR